MNQGGACAYGEEVRAEALPFRKEKEIKRSLTCWNTVNVEYSLKNQGFNSCNLILRYK